MDCSLHSDYFLHKTANVPGLPKSIKHAIQHGSNQEFLAAISAAAVEPQLIESIFVHFEPLAFEICARWNIQNVVATTQAFARILPIFPHLAEVAREHFSSLKELNILSHLDDLATEDSISRNRALLLAVHRLLNFDNDGFARFILPAKLQLYLQHDDLAIRHLAVKIICQYMRASDGTLEDMKSKYFEANSVAVASWDERTIDYEFLSLWEVKRLSDLQSRLIATRTARANYDRDSTVSRILQANDFSPTVLMIADVLLPRKPPSIKADVKDNFVVSNATTDSNLRLIANALIQPYPLLLTGLAGSGKTTFVKYLAGQVEKASSMVTLHLNEQSDAKLLVGLYTTGTEAGSFKWQPGVLTTAVTEGRWVFIEDLDRAPNEVMSTLLPLIERGELLVPSQGQKIKAAAGFRIIATMRSIQNSKGENVSPISRMLGRRLWNVLHIAPLSFDETKQMIVSQFPLLTSIITSMMMTYEHLTATHEIKSTSIKSDLRNRPISNRELLKWTERVNDTLKAAQARNGNNSLSEADLDSIFLDAVDCFAGNFQSSSTKDALITKIAQQLHIDPQRRTYLLENRSINLKRVPLDGSQAFRIGRAIAPIQSTKRPVSVRKDFALNGFSLRLLERVAVAIQRREPLLLVGETGIGKTAAIQHLAELTNNNLIAINLSQQSEAGDLLGGLKPANTRSMAIPLKDEFDSIFTELFSQKKNQEFSEQLSKCISKSQWKRAAMLWNLALRKAHESISEATPIFEGDASQGNQSKRRKLHSQYSPQLRDRLKAFSGKLEAFQRQVAAPANAVRFTYAEGKLVTAVREGHWVLLDEINLASPDTLECLSDLLEAGPNARPFLILAESGKVERIEAHSNFRIFGAMNPATDVGKKDLPLGIRSRFSELYVESPDQDSQSLQDIAKLFLERMSPGVSEKGLSKVVTDLYQHMQKVSSHEGLVDGSGQPTHFSLRTFTRALSHANTIAPQCSIRRALYEGFSLCFLTCLDVKCESRLQELVKTHIFSDARAAKSELKKSFRPPRSVDDYMRIVLNPESKGHSHQASEETHWMPKGQMQVEIPSEYIITPYISRNLRNLIRAAFARNHPILIQGPTSAGKTSMVEYLAKRSGNRFVRINNHEHTDLQEYLGTYVSTPEGQLVFQEGILVQAVRQGHWIVLDELNLAPTDVLEALNRLLDDNRELLIPETQEVVKPHKDFMLFATQNPAGPYGGRKFLSRAFRNRFIELHFDDIPVEELNIILSRRCNLPESWCGLIVEVYRRLSALRQEQRLFEANSFATLRDLFRWAFRGAESVEQLATQGYMLLAAKVRKKEERESVQRVIEQVMSRKGVRINLNEDIIFSRGNCPEMSLYDQYCGDIIWTRPMRRLFTLTAHAIRNNEAVLLVGETGCGKTSVCQMLAQAMQKSLHAVNAHQNTETGDLIGAQRPIRNRSSLEQELRADLHEILAHLRVTDGDLNQETASLLATFDTLEADQLNLLPELTKLRIESNRKRIKSLFEWQDGSLVQAMRSGSYYLLDEISLAEDSVLERLNSVLDPSRSLLLAEKGTSDSLIVAKDGFQFFATMNPGGDFGKKELSPALRNRFTEIWVPPLSEVEDVLQIVEAKLIPEAKPYALSLVEFAKWFGDTYASLKDATISVRDLLSWVNFVNSQDLPLVRRILHGAAMVYVDTIGANPSALLEISASAVSFERKRLINKLSQLLKINAFPFFQEPLDFAITESSFRIGDFYLNRANCTHENTPFHFDTPGTKLNAMRIVRALQSPKPALIEGSPGVGKSSIVAAIANAAGRALTRINLSEQTDLMDLFGSDVPMENAEAGLFAWRDAPFLTAMKRGDWVLLDEMNLASQSVLEGLNACLDHRAEIYVSELDQTFSRHTEFRLFAAQNPHHQGGGRKGLPASFVNRFTVVYAEPFQKEDLAYICAKSYPTIHSAEVIAKLVEFVSNVDRQITSEKSFGIRGAPWEFNLRDLLRWLQLIATPDGLLAAAEPQDFVNLLFLQRFRTWLDTDYVKNLFQMTFGVPLTDRQYFKNIGSKTAQIGLALTSRGEHRAAQRTNLVHLRQSHPLLESLLLCVQQNWPVLLVGSSGSGKSYLLSTLASVCGADLETYALNADTDATDLVGGFEQVDRSRQINSFLIRLRILVSQLLGRSLLQIDGKDTAALTGSLFEVFSYVQSVGVDDVNFALIKEYLYDFSSLWSTDQIQALIEDCDILSRIQVRIESALFEWVDGVLVEALEAGRWLVLDHANLCSSSVLDRLNSLLEPGGSLLINENCHSDGTPRLIKPHPNFRIFLTVDPQYGEVSRAMRNRAVEIFVNPHREGSAQASAFAELVEPSMMGFLDVMDIASTELSPAHSMPVLDTAFERLSLAENNLLQRFASEAISGLFPRGADDFSKLSTRQYIMDYLFPGWPSVVYQFHKIMESRFNLSRSFSSETIHILINQPLAALARTLQSPDETLCRGLVQSILFDITHLQQTLQASTSLQDMVSQKLRTSKVSRSNNQDPFLDGINFLNETQKSFVDWTNATISSEHYEHAVAVFVRDTQSLCQFLFDSLLDLALDETCLRTIFQHISKTMNNIQNQSVLSSQLTLQLVSSIKSFSQSTELDSGLSLESLWHIYRPSPPASAECLRSVLLLESLADQFDSSCWEMRVSFNEICNLRRSIAKTIGVAYGQMTDVDSLLQTFSETITIPRKQKKLEGIDRRPWFRAAFEQICQRHKIKSRGIDSHLSGESRLMDLHLLACRPTKLQNLSPKESNIQSALDLLSEAGGFESHSSNHTDTLWSIVTENLCRSKDVSLDQMSLLQVELQSLGHEISRNTEILNINVAPILFKAIIDLIENLVFMHQNVFDDLFISRVSTTGLQSTLENLSSFDNFQQSLFGGVDKGYHKIQRLLAELLYSVAVFTSPVDWTSSNSLLKLSNSLVGCALVFLLLYVPNRPFDPALKAKVELRMYDCRKDSLESAIKVRSQIEGYLTGSSSNGLIALLEEELQSLGPQPDLPAVIRPLTSQLNRVQAEFNNVLRLVRSLFDSWVDRESQTPAQDPGVIENVSSAARRLNDCPPEYRDLTVPAMDFLHILKFGLEMSLQYRHNDTSSFSSCPRHWAFATFLPGFRGTRVSDDESRSHPGFCNTSSQKRQLLRLKSFALSSSLNPPSKWSLSAQSESDSLFYAFYRDWKDQLQKDRRAAEKASSFYHYRGSKDENDGEEEDEFHDLFPLYEDTTEHPRPPDISDELSPQALAAQVAEFHIATFLDSVDAVQAWSDIILRSSEIERHDENDRKPADDTALIPAVMLQTYDIYRELSSEDHNTSNYNFYVDPNPAEARRVTKIVHQIQDKIEDTLEIWPEHETLRDILLTCTELLQFRRCDPVVKFLTKAEKLHDYLAEWQSVTSREYSAESSYQSLTDLLISWRQLELSTWAKLLDLETEKCEKDAKAWWFMAYENIYAIKETELPSEYLSDHISQLLEALDVFIRTSSIGQFRRKLSLLESIKIQMSVTAQGNDTSRRIHNALDHIVSYFDRFVTIVEEKIRVNREELEKKIKEVLKLASWSDRNVHALKESAKSSHRRLFRVVRKYRELLSQPVAPLLEQDMPIFHRKLSNPGSDLVISISASSHAAATDRCKTQKASWTERPARVKNIASTVYVMQSRINPSTDSESAASRLESFLDSVETSITQLQKETPTTLTKENLELTKHITSRKKRLVAETLKAVRMMGMTSNPPADITANQKNLCISLSRLSGLPSASYPEPAFHGQSLLHSTLHVMDSVRAAAKSHHDDISRVDISRCIGSLESIVAFAMRQHNSVSSYLFQLQDLNQLMVQAGQVWGENGVNVAPRQSSPANQLAYVKEVVLWLPSLLRIVSKTLLAQAHLGDLDFSSLLNELHLQAAEFDAQKSSLLEQADLPKSMITFQEMKLLETIHISIESLLAKIDQYSTREPTNKARVILDPLVSWIEAHRSIIKNGNGTIKHRNLETNDEVFDKKVMKMVDLVLGSIQDVEHNLQSVAQNSATEKGWLVTASQDLQSTIKAFHLPNITEALQSICLLLSDIIEASDHEETATFSYYCASFALVLPVLQKYQELVREAVEPFVELYKATCKASYKLAKSFNIIATQGFCKPAEKSEDKGDVSEKLESGTGLGEGDGAEDISKDIAEDEDLSELAQDPENKTKDKEMGNEDDAVDIEDGLEGTAGDEAKREDNAENKPQEEEDDASSVDLGSQDGSVGEGEGAEEEDRGETRDNEVGDVDDLGPSAVDEKLWDEAGEDDGKDKQGKQSSKENKTDQAAGAEENGDENEAEVRNEDQENESHGSDINMSDVEENEATDEAEGLDPHLKESEAFDLPEDLQLDGDKTNTEDLDLDASDEDVGNLEDEIDENVSNTMETDQLEEGQSDVSEPEEAENTADKEIGEPGETQSDEAAEDEVDNDGAYGEPDAADETIESGGSAADNAKNTQAEEQANAEARGTGPEEASQDQEMSAGSAQRQSGVEMQPSTETQAGRTEAGQTSAEEQLPRESRDVEMIKQLGNALEQWHKQHKEIREAQTEREEGAEGQENVEMIDPEFEHLADESAKEDTQAIGAAKEDQTQALDDKMAIASTETEKQNVPRDDVQANEEDEDYEMQDANPEAHLPEQDPDEGDESTNAIHDADNAFIGERKDPELDDNSHRIELQDTEDLEHVDDQLSTMQIEATKDLPSSTTDPGATWQHHEARTYTLSQALTAQLRLILEPTQATKLRGDFRTGKRLNIKRIIPYIASSYKRDKIWMRRSVPTKRAYQVMLAIDDSRSMAGPLPSSSHTQPPAPTPKRQAQSKDLAFDTLALLSKALTSLEAGEIAVTGFGQDVFLAHDFSPSLSAADGASILGQFTFSQTRTDVAQLLRRSIEIFADARRRQTASSARDLWQLQLIVSDGICEDHEGIRRLLVRAREERILVVFVIVDAAGSAMASSSQAASGTSGTSILDLETVEFVGDAGDGAAGGGGGGGGGAGAGGAEGEMRLVRRKYLDTFPFTYYLVVKDVMELPHVLATALRQWFAEIAER